MSPASGRAHSSARLYHLVKVQPHGVDYVGIPRITLLCLPLCTLTGFTLVMFDKLSISQQPQTTAERKVILGALSGLDRSGRRSRAERIHLVYSKQHVIDRLEMKKSGNNINNSGPLLTCSIVISSYKSYKYEGTDSAVV